MKKFTIIFLAFATYYILHITYYIPVLAQESSPSASPLENSFLQKLNELREEVASKAAQIKLDINKKLQNKVHIGEISGITETEIKLLTRNEEKKIILNEYTEYDNETPRPEFGDFKNRDYIAALGDIDDKGSLVAKKVVRLEKKEPDKKKFYFGQVKQVISSTITIDTKANENLNIVASNDTQYGTGNDEAVFSDIKVGARIVVVGIPNENGIIQAEFIYLAAKI